MNFEDYETLPTTNVTSHMMAGAFAGIMEHCVMYPLDSVKTRMQSLSVSHHNLSISTVLGKMIQQEGLLRPLRGIEVAVVGAGPAHALYFSCYEFLKEVLTTRFNVNNHLAHGFAGCSATVLHDGIMTPADVVKQRMQMYDSPYRGVMDCIRKTYRVEGFGAFYRSYTTQLAMNLPFQSIHFMAYEIAQTMTNPMGEYNPRAHMLSGALAGGIAAAVTTPLDVCKTLLNTQSEGKLMVRGFLNAVRTVYRLGGPLGFFKGLSARVMFQMPATAISWSTYEFFKYCLITKGKEDHHHEDKKREIGSGSSIGSSLYGVPCVAFAAAPETNLLEVSRR
ncbi:mitoferrin-1 isoform X1 [Halyomorpha halys]|uniref:mitoferrin-1 isoform X1 n=1 Tax=Halyomorpha halys TaxID=286706 RepID=UPI0006D4D2DD|nr:mitoferrin-1 isoform X1 [Halyomorpha halys]